jgi:hypothetical protein
VEEALRGEEELNMDLLWRALDSYRQAVAFGRGQDIEVMCIAYTKIAYIYLKIMKDAISVFRGKQNLQDIMELAKVTCCLKISSTINMSRFSGRTETWRSTRGGSRPPASRWSSSKKPSGRKSRNGATRERSLWTSWSLS